MNDISYSHLMQSTFGSSDEESIDNVTNEGLCSPPDVIKGDVVWGKEAEWFNRHQCHNLTKRSEREETQMDNITLSVYPIRSYFSCSGDILTPTDSIAFGVTIDGHKLVVAHKHVTHPDFDEYAAEARDAMYKTNPAMAEFLHQIAFWVVAIGGVLCCVCFFFAGVIASQAAVGFVSILCCLIVAVLFMCLMLHDSAGKQFIKRVHDILLFRKFSIKLDKVVVDGNVMDDTYREGLFGWKVVDNVMEFRLIFAKIIDKRLYSFRNSGDLVLLQFEAEPTWQSPEKRYLFRAPNNIINEAQVKRGCDIRGVTYNIYLHHDLCRWDPRSQSRKHIRYSADSLNTFFKVDKKNCKKRLPIGVTGEFTRSTDRFCGGDVCTCCWDWLVDIYTLIKYICCCKSVEGHGKLNLIKSFYYAVWLNGKRRHLVKLNTVAEMRGTPVFVTDKNDRNDANDMTNNLSGGSDASDIKDDEKQSNYKDESSVGVSLLLENEAEIECIGIVATGVNSANYEFEESTVLQPMIYAKKLVECREKRIKFRKKRKRIFF